MDRRCQHSLGSPPPLRPKRAAKTAAQGFAPADSPTTTANQKKGDTSNEVKKGTFLKRLDTSLSVTSARGSNTRTLYICLFHASRFGGMIFFECSERLLLIAGGQIPRLKYLLLSKNLFAARKPSACPVQPARVNSSALTSPQSVDLPEQESE